MRSCSGSFLGLWLFIVATAPVQALEPPAPSGRAAHTFRITGLFVPEREAALRQLVTEHLPDVRVLAVDFANGEATFEFDADQLLQKPNATQLIERFDNLLRSHSRSTFGARARCAIPRDQLQAVTIPIAGLDCLGCCLGAYDAIYRLDGVEWAAVSFREGRASALINPAQIDRAQLVTALRQRGVTIRETP
ncbi:MAG: heavy metal-associated domain-containing protein [Pirellulales bacterium]